MRVSIVFFSWDVIVSIDRYIQQIHIQYRQRCVTQKPEREIYHSQGSVCQLSHRSNIKFTFLPRKTQAVMWSVRWSILNNSYQQVQLVEDNDTVLHLKKSQTFINRFSQVIRKLENNLAAGQAQSVFQQLIASQTKLQFYPASVQ